jgi:hypothetical protein
MMVLVKLKKRSLPWGYGRFALNHLAFRRIAGLRFGKMLGSGYQGGFGLRPSFDRQALFLVFDNESSAEACLLHEPLIARYRQVCDEFFSVLLEPYAAKGSWSGQQLQPTAVAPPTHAPIAALTRAAINSRALAAFWRDASPAHADMAQAKGCLLAAGVGELPVIRQATFTMWENLAAMNHYARSGAHQAAIVHSTKYNYFTESMFVRFIARNASGVYKGQRYGIRDESS